jgi:two-component system OmpR family response regulator
MRLRPHGFQPIILFEMESDHVTKAGESSGTAAQGQSKPPHRILLVDDDPDIRSLNADVLVRAGYHVDTAENGVAGWKALQANRYDALITDNTMPGVTGLDLIKQLRSADMTLSVILASGTVPAEELNRCPWLEVSALLPKPYSIAELLRTVDQVLRTANGVR